MAKSKLARYRARRRNPSRAVKEVTELATSIGVGFAGYGAARLVSRMVFAQAVRRWPGAAKHLHVAATALSAAGVYFGTRHWEKLDEYHEAASIGAGIALLQAGIQTYLPKFGWVTADVDASQYAAKKERATLPDADFDQLQLDAPAPAAEAGFDLDRLLAEHPDIEAVPVGQMAPAAEHVEYTDEDDNLGAFGNATGFGDLDDLENYNGMLN